jgi:tRNA1Val (adenine37-N6)-methyltransferase
MSTRMTKTAGPRPRSGETLDTFHRGRVRLFQKKRGYRFSVDAPLLADFIRTRKSDDILEVGTGSGIVALLLGGRPFRRITALEVQPGLAALARRNIALNGLESKVAVVKADYRVYGPGRKFDLVFSNPPYIPKAGGFLSRVTERSVARHELRGGIADLMRKTAEWLKPGGRACFVFPERRRRDFLAAAASHGLRVRRFRPVKPRAGESPNLFLVEVGFAGRGGRAGTGRRKGRGGGENSPAPLVLFKKDGSYTAEAEAIFSGRR